MTGGYKTLPYKTQPHLSSMVYQRDLAVLPGVKLALLNPLPPQNHKKPATLWGKLKSKIASIPLHSSTPAFRNSLLELRTLGFGRKTVLHQETTRWLPRNRIRDLTIQLQPRQPCRPTQNNKTHSKGSSSLLSAAFCVQAGILIPRSHDGKTVRSISRQPAKESA